MKLKASVIGLLCSLFCTAQDITVSDIPTMSQLPDGSVHCIYRDREGYLWYATNNGLARDDGYSINVLRPDTDSYIRSIAEDSTGRIWACTNNGAYTLDKKNYRFTPFDKERLKGNPVNSIFFSSDGTGWLNQHGTLRRYDKNANWVKDYTISDRRGAPTYVSGICQTRAGELLITTYSRGIYRYDSITDSFKMYAPVNQDVSLGELMQDVSHDYLWVCDHDGHLYRVDPHAAIPDSMYIRSDITTPDGRSGQRIYSFTQDKRHGYLWALSTGYLLAFKPEANGHLTPLSLPVCDRYFGHMIDKIQQYAGMLWLSNFDSPSARIYIKDNNIKSLDLQGLENRGGSRLQPVITAVVPDADPSYLWLIQMRRGLLLYNLKTNEKTYHDDDITMKPMRLRLSEEITPSRFLDGVWVSQTRSICVHGVSRQGDKMIKADSVKLDNIVTKGVRITKLLEDSHSHLWIGTTAGLFGYDLLNRKFCNKLPQIGYVVGLKETPEGTIWIASKDKGLFMMQSAADNNIKNYHCVNELSTIDIAPNGHVWLGTDNGKIMSFNPGTHTLSDHTEQCNAGDIIVKQISIDKVGHVFIVTDKALIEYNPRSGTRYIYNSGSDTHLSRFLSTIPAYSQSGELMLSGVGGIGIISPTNKLDLEESRLPTYITDVTVGGRSLIMADSTGRFTNGNTVVLNPDDRNIEFHFSTLRPRYNKKVRFAYRIKGIDPDWNYTALGENVAFYNSINRGKYTLEVKVCDENNLWSSNVTTLTIDRKAAFFESWWAFLIYLFILLALVYWALRIYSKRMRRESEEIWADSQEMMKMRSYLESTVTLPEEEFMELDKLFLEKATKVVEANISVSDFNVDSLAKGVNMSRSTLSRKLKAISGCTPLDFIRHIKMQHACRLLETKNHSVSEVAEMVGYSDRRYFTSSFKKEFGVIPSDYQKGIREDSSKGDKSA